MRVTYFHYVTNSPGSLVQISEFAKAFRSLGHQLNIHAMDAPFGLATRDGIGGAFRRRLSRYGHEVNAVRKNLAYYRRECRIVQEEQPDILLTRHKLYAISSALVARQYRIPLVLWIHAPIAYQQRTYLRDFVQIPGIAAWMERVFVTMADRAIAVSEELKQFPPMDGLRDGRVVVIPNGVDPEKFSPSVEDGRIRMRFPMANPVVLGFVGTFAPWHGLESLKAMVSWALRTNERACVLLVGDGPRRAEFEAWARQGPWDPRRVYVTGHLDYQDVPTHIAAMDVCLLPYDQTNDGFYFSPLKLFEYLACGKAVLAARIGQVERIIRDGLNGALYAPGTQEELVAKLEELVGNASLRARLGVAGRLTVLQNYTWRHAARAVERVLESVLQERRDGL